ncbi:MAG: hypothetical protein DSY82_05490 [Flavobacteriia bacterium]|nr:MAG: hypothetical protein DSY82_05490 [Flavobacteriia bacterium]
MYIKLKSAGLRYLWIIVFLLQMNVYPQSAVEGFFKLSTPEKCWVIFHPFKAKKAFKITKEALFVTDSITKLKILTDLNGGRADAFKHSYWLSRLTQEIGVRAALKLGKAHEKGNYQFYKKGKKEDGYLPDKPSSDMDLYNNNVGAGIAQKNLQVSKHTMVELIISAVKSGEMKILKKDSKGNFLTCSGEVISKESLQSKWENKKCLVSSGL